MPMPAWNELVAEPDLPADPQDDGARAAADMYPFGRMLNEARVVRLAGDAVASSTQTVACRTADLLHSGRLQSSAATAAVRTPLPPPGSRIPISAGDSRTWSMEAMKRATPIRVKNCPRYARRLESVAGRFLGFGGLGRSSRSMSRHSRRFDAVTADDPPIPLSRGVLRASTPRGRRLRCSTLPLPTVPYAEA